MEDFFYRHNDATIIRAQGEDAEDYLQSQWSIDIRKLGKGGVRFGLRLNLKGKILAGAYIARLNEEEFLLISENTPDQDMVEMLEENVVADEVEFFDETPKWDLVSLQINKSDASLGTLLGVSRIAEGYFTQEEDRLLFLDERMKTEQYLALLQKDSSAFKSISEKMEEIFSTHYDIMKINEQKFSIPKEIGVDDLPQEAGMERSAVDFDKGCYLGQEVMARLHAMGKVQRQVLAIRLERKNFSPPSLPIGILLGDKIVGQIKSLVIDENSWIGVAKIHLKAKEKLIESGLETENQGMGRIFSL
jgi:folate-binding protein YgfZ